MCKAGQVRPRVWAAHSFGCVMRPLGEGTHSRWSSTLTKRYLMPVKRLIYVLSVCYLCVRDVCLWCQYFWESTGRETLVLHILGFFWPILGAEQAPEEAVQQARTLSHEKTEDATSPESLGSHHNVTITSMAVTTGFSLGLTWGLRSRKRW